jgi:hypothetical protein
MWMINPRVMCRKHLLGEHVEIHMLAGSLWRGRSVAGHLAKGQLEPAAMGCRHRALAAEMARRGYRHASPLAVPPYAAVLGKFRVDVVRSRKDLAARCDECRAMMKEAK